MDCFTKASVNIEGSACFEVDCIRTALYLFFRFQTGRSHKGIEVTDVIMDTPMCILQSFSTLRMCNFLMEKIVLGIQAICCG